MSACTTFEPLLAESLLCEPGVNLERHLESCPACAARRAGLGATIELVRAAQPAAPEEADLVASILEAALAPRRPDRGAPLLAVALLGVALAALGLLGRSATPALEPRPAAPHIELPLPSDEALVRTLDLAGGTRPGALLQAASSDELDVLAGAAARGLLRDDALATIDPLPPGDELAALDGAALERAMTRLPRAQ